MRKKGVHRGIGFVSLIELTNPSPAFYGVGGAKIAAQDGCAIRLDPTGGVTCLTGVTEQGQGTETVIAQVAATAIGVSMEKVRVVTGDTDVVPYGGGTWASRAAGIGGEAALHAGRELRLNILKVAAAILQTKVSELDIRDSVIIDGATGKERMPLSELGRIAYFRGDTLPKDVQPELLATKHYVNRDFPFIFTNAAHACHLETDTETGMVKLLKYWVVEDCGTVINPLLVAEQTRGGVVQGIGPALYEECLYSPEGQLINGLDGRLPAAHGGGDARDRRRPRGHADGFQRTRRQGRRRGRHGGGAGRHHERHQRRAAADERAPRRHALHARQDPPRAWQDLRRGRAGAMLTAIRARVDHGRGRTRSEG